jgi:hypothetical protein
VSKKVKIKARIYVRTWPVKGRNRNEISLNVRGPCLSASSRETRKRLSGQKLQSEATRPKEP